MSRSVHYMAHTNTQQTPLGHAIEERRRDKGWTIAKAAREAGVSRGTWHELESGTRMNAMPETMNLIESALEMPAGSLRRTIRPLTDEQVGLAADGIVRAEQTSALEANTYRRRMLVGHAAQLNDDMLRKVLHFIDGMITT